VLATALDVYVSAAGLGGNKIGAPPGRMAGVIPIALWAESRCPSCGAQIRNRHNVPVLGWLILRGRCFGCKAPISPRYPLVEAMTGVLFALVTLRIVGLHLAAALPAYLYFAAAGVALAMIDVDHKRLPDKIVLPSYPVLAVLLTVAAAAQHDWWALARAAIGAAALFAFYFATAFAYPAGMGFGDVKLAGLLGGVRGYLSWSTWQSWGCSRTGLCWGPCDSATGLRRDQPRARTTACTSASDSWPKSS